MSKIKLTGDTSGYVEISAPNVAANNTLELGGGTKILTNLDNVFTGVTTYSGNIDLNANLDLDDNNKILLGTGDDLQIYHNGSESIILDAGTGQLNIRTDLLRVNNTNDNETLATFANNGAVSLYYDNSKKLETTTTGATVTGTLVSGSVTSELDLTAISSSITDTAVDIFVYDTRKDSDGGAWRKRTQHTSWYNETLNTSTRGSRKEFPAVAVIVAETTKVTIYDGDDPDLPMWMIFTWSGTGNSALGYDNRAKSAVTMSNGQLVTCGNPDGVHIARFVYDDVVRYTHTGYFRTTDAIAERTGVPHITINTTDVLVASTCNDVAMTVLSNAPIDPSTGLPIPTIAVATNGGISVITDSGSVYDLTTGDVYDVYGKVEFGDNNRLYYTGTNTQVLYSHAIPSADQNYTAYNTQNTNRVMFPTMDHGGFTSGHPVKLLGTNGSSNPLLIVKNKASGSNETSYSPTGIDPRPGLSFIDDGETNPTSTVAYATTSYNTGWMHGDIKGTFLSDTDTTNATSGEILSNGDFTNGTTGWTIQDSGEGSISSSSNQLTLNNSTSSDPPVACYQQISLEDGKYYNVTSNKASGLDVVVNITTGTSNGGGTGGYGNVILHSSNGDKGATFLATAATMYCYIRVNTNATGTAVMNFVSIRKAEEDRSHNITFLRDKVSALTINGTITKSAVATGADLVAYSGFSASNVLVQPYNSNLNPGTGNYSFMCWFKCPSTGAEQILMRRFGVPTVTGGTMMRIVSSSSVIQWYVRDTSSTATAISSTMALDDGNWHCAVGTREGSIAKLYIDGELNSTSGCSANSHDPGTTADFVIGAEENGGSPGTYQNPADVTSLALVRYSLSAPSAEQIKKIYEDEKVLFQENAKATLYGSSDAVTALGYDEDTELLHVGTSAGRSDFQGLRRINNTTTAVTTAISASDDLIAEQ